MSRPFTNIEWASWDDKQIVEQFGQVSNSPKQILHLKFYLNDENIPKILPFQI